MEETKTVSASAPADKIEITPEIIDARVEEYSIGFSEILSDVTEPMKLLMREIHGLLMR